ncbi:MAG: SGNH/GDSL hydrolase family protein [Bacteroidota bacterium]
MNEHEESVTMKNIPGKITFVFILLFIASVGICQVPTAQKLDSNMALNTADQDGMVWLDPRDAPFELDGFEWIAQDGIYRRLPVHPDWEIRDEVDELANHTAGGQIRFSTNSRRLLIRVKLMERSGMYHMPATGQSGFDLYLQDGQTKRYVSTTRFPHDSTQYQVELFNVNDQEMRSFILNFPLYNGVASVLVGIEKGSQIKEPPPLSFTGKIVMYGTSITQGGCVARPGMAYSNILSRRLDAAFVNLGFSGNGRGEPALAHLINQIPGVTFVILDYEANANETIVNTLEPFVDILREKHPDTPILIMSKIRYTSATTGSPAHQLLMENRDFQRTLVEKRNRAGDHHIFFLDGSTVLGEDYSECTVDGSHPTDLGSVRIADALTEAINIILSRQ